MELQLPTTGMSRARTQSTFFILLMEFVLLQLCHGKPRESSNMESNLDRELSAFDVISRVCLSDDTDRLVYRFQNETHIFIGFDVVKDDVIYTMVWKTSDKKDELLFDQNLETGRYDKHASTEFRENISTEHVLAAANKVGLPKYAQIWTNSYGGSALPSMQGNDIEPSKPQHVFDRIETQRHFRRILDQCRGGIFVTKTCLLHALSSAAMHMEEARLQPHCDVS